MTPISDHQQTIVVAKTAQFIRVAEITYGREFGQIPVYFDLSGRASGMYKVKGRERCIRYNPYIFALYFEQHLIDTVSHEVAHYIADCTYGSTYIKPHGAEWRAIVVEIGGDTSRTFNHELEGVPLRKHRQVAYSCQCGERQLGIRRHNKVCRGEAVYKCRQCHDELVLAAE